MNVFGSICDLKVCNQPQYPDSNRAEPNQTKEKSIVIASFCGLFVKE